MSGYDYPVIDDSTATMIAELLGFVAKGIGQPSIAAILPAATKLAMRLTDSGYTAPGLDEFKDKLDAFEALGDVPTMPGQQA